MVPFSAEEFFGVFAAYNAAVWPAQLILVGAAAGAIALTLRRSTAAGRWVAGFLALLWLWTGVVYHLLHFTAINPAAAGFGVVFVAQGLLFLWLGVVRGRLDFAAEATPRGIAGGVMLAYALLVYPLIGALAGHAYMASPTFGAPCPAVIYTFGLLLLARRVPWWLLVVPVAWALLGLSAVLALGVPQDAGLVVSALVAVGFQVADGRARRRAALRPERAAADAG